VIGRAMEAVAAGQLGEAESLARQVLQNNPNNGPALYCLGLVAQLGGNHPEAATLIRQAMAVSGSAPEYAYNLSHSLAALGDFGGAESALREAIRLKPDFVEAYTNLGGLLMRRGDLISAVAAFDQSASLRPADPRCHLNLGKVYRELDRLDDAEAAFRRAITNAPSFAPGWNMLGSCLREAGRIGDAIKSFERATQLDPSYRESHSNLCYALYFDPSASGSRILQTHRDWARKFANVRPMKMPSFDRSPDRRLKIGYVSPNFCSHVIGSFLLPIFEHHDRSNFELMAYSDTPNPDQLTGRLKQSVQLWRVTAGMKDLALAELIRRDGVDVLVDLALHMRGSRLGAFAQSPAPVQLTHLAYCGTSGIGQMDGCISDVHMAGDAESFFAEPLLKLPRSYWSYRPVIQTPEVGPLPSIANGHVTFGSLNTLAKVNDRVIAVWSRILKGVPGSRLALFVPGGHLSDSLNARFGSHGIERGRLMIYPRQPLVDYFQAYNNIDIALDPFPYNGGTTTLDALWMGVPVVTLEGTLPVGRAGASILTNIGMDDLIAQTEDDYVMRAVELGSNRNRLAMLRSQIRGKLNASCYSDAKGYVCDLEGLYRNAWLERIKRP